MNLFITTPPNNSTEPLFKTIRPTLPFLLSKQVHKIVLLNPYFRQVPQPTPSLPTAAIVLHLFTQTTAFLFIIMAITVSATYPATDTTAGERERGTLETLLTFPIKSKDIIVGKFLGVTVSSIITGIISLALAIISLMITKNMFSIYEGMDVMYSPITILFAVIVIIAYSFFISGLCIAIASTSKTFKEAQSALTPLTFISFFPGMIAFMMGITTTPILSIVPFLNFTLIFTDINNGTINLLNIGLMAISTIIYISLVFAHIIKQYKSEKVLFAK